MNEQLNIKENPCLRRDKNGICTHEENIFESKCGVNECAWTFRELNPKEMVEQLLRKSISLLTIRTSSIYSEEVKVEAYRRFQWNIRSLRAYGNHNEKLEKLLEEMKK